MQQEPKQQAVGISEENSVQKFQAVAKNSFEDEKHGNMKNNMKGLKNSDIAVGSNTRNPEFSLFVGKSEE